jgi:hypothetical protein
MLNLSVGLSGCKLELIENNLLRKFSSSINYNARLSKQIDKQNLFSKFILKNIDTPKIINTSYEGLYYFDMEYIHGLSFYDYFLTADILDIKFVIETLFNYFDFFSLNYRTINVQSKLLDKLSDLEKKTLYPEYLKFLKNYVESNKIIVPKTFCHGDLTFNNIIFHKNRLFLIDFLDSYIDSFLCDLVKLKQDLYYLWSLTVQEKSDLRVKQIYSYIWKCLNVKYSQYIQTPEFEILDVINSLRIEPYLTNDNQRIILDNMIKYTNLYAKFNCADGRKI